MVILPILILMSGALAMWLARKGTVRLGWAIAAAAALLAAASSFLLSGSIPLQSSLSVWRPLDLFAAQIELRLDAMNIKPIIAGSTVVLAVVLSAVVKLADKDFRLRALTLVYCALSLMAMLSANLLTITLAWALLDLVTLLFGLSAATDSAAVASLLARVVVGVSGIFAIIGTSIVNTAAGGTDDLGIPLANPWATALLVIAVILRLGLVRLDSDLSRLAGSDDATMTLMSVLSPSAALVILARQFALGIPAELINWLRAGASIGVLVFGTRWMLEDEGMERQRFLVLGLSFLGILVSTIVPARFELPLLSAIMILIIVGTMTRITRIHSPWHRAFPVLGVLIMVMPAWAAGAMLIQGLGTALQLDINLWVAIVGIVGLAMLAGGMLGDVSKHIGTWYVDDLARLLYSAALVVPVIVGFGLGLDTASGFGARAILVTVLTSGAMIGSYILVQRLDSDSRQRVRGAAERLHMGPVLRAGEGGMRWASGALRWVGGILEGEGAMLWVFVIVLLIQLVIVGGSQ